MTRVARKWSTVDLRRHTALALCVLAVGVATACGSTDDPERESAAAPNSGSQSYAGFLACRDKVLVGSILKVDQGGKDRQLLTLDVVEWIKPSTGPAKTTLDVLDPNFAADTARAFRLNDQVLLAHPAPGAEDPFTEAWFDKEVPAARAEFVAARSESGAQVCAETPDAIRR